MNTIVVARYNENIEWINELDSNIIVINKSQITNYGREASSYFYFIVNNYTNLVGNYLFCQGNPFDHCKNFLDIAFKEKFYGEYLTCDNRGHVNPSALGDGIRLQEFADRLNIKLQIMSPFVAGGQFLTNVDKIKQNTLSFYQKCLEMTKEENAAYIFERLYYYIFKYA